MTNFSRLLKYWGRIMMLQYIQSLMNSESELDREDGYEYYRLYQKHQLLGV